eukprot:4855049-Amphidinium_carterae.1
MGQGWGWWWWRWWSCQLLGSRMVALEDMRNVLVDETYSLRVQYNEMLQVKGIEAMQACGDINRQERHLRVQ